MSMGLVIFVVGGSYLLSILLNKIGQQKGWKKKAMAYLDEKPAMRNLPIVVGILGVAALVVIPKLGFNNIMIMIPFQVIVITLAAFLFELFRDE